MNVSTENFQLADACRDTELKQWKNVKDLLVDEYNGRR